MTICVKNNIQENAVVNIAPTPTSLQKIRKEVYFYLYVHTYEKSLGVPNHIGGVKMIAIKRNQKQKLVFGKTLLKSS